MVWVEWPKPGRQKAKTKLCSGGEQGRTWLSRAQRSRARWGRTRGRLRRQPLSRTLSAFVTRARGLSWPPSPTPALKADWQDTKAHILTTANTCVCIMLFGGSLYYNFVRPTLNEMKDKIDTLERSKMENDKVIKQVAERLLIEDRKSKTKISESQSMQATGRDGKESGGHQPSND
ncbi:hypothetical protein BS78_10G023100 [Paspalum vaginatum]|nr:hypothetical protein BS78_10G023100 [Paspalum vaginatum]